MPNSEKYLVNLYKQLESLIGSIYEKYKDQFSPEDREDYEEMFAQGEYELAMSSLLASLKNNNIILEQGSLTKVDEIYKLMEISKPL